jgi:general secretion pathway protein K
MVVLWILTFLSVMFTAFVFSMRTELAAAGNFREDVEAYYLAEAGVYRAAAEIINADRYAPPNTLVYDSLNETWHTNPAAYDGVQLGRGRYWVTVTDEESKIPLNGATEAVLRRLFSNSGVKDTRRLSIIVDSILDWRDPDKLHRVNGAEDDYYLSLPVPYKARNGSFETIEELLLVKGMSSEILYGNVTDPARQAELREEHPGERQLASGEYLGVAKHLSIFGLGQVNVNTAGPEVLMALGLTAAETKLALARRADAPFHSVGDLTNLLTSLGGAGRQGFEIVGAGQPGATPLGQAVAELSQMGIVSSRSFYVESAGRLDGSRFVSRIAAVLRNDGGAGRSRLSIGLWSLGPGQGA